MVIHRGSHRRENHLGGGHTKPDRCFVCYSRTVLIVDRRRREKRNDRDQPVATRGNTSNETCIPCARRLGHGTRSKLDFWVGTHASFFSALLSLTTDVFSQEDSESEPLLSPSHNR